MSLPLGLFAVRWEQLPGYPIAVPAGSAKEVHGGNAAQNLGSLAKGRRVGARPCYQADGEPHVAEHPRRAQSAQRVGGGKDDFGIGATQAQAFQEGRYVSAK